MNNKDSVAVRRRNGKRVATVLLVASMLSMSGCGAAMPFGRAVAIEVVTALVGYVLDEFMLGVAVANAATRDSAARDIGQAVADQLYELQRYSCAQGEVLEDCRNRLDAAVRVNFDQYRAHMGATFDACTRSNMSTYGYQGPIELADTRLNCMANNGYAAQVAQVRRHAYV